MRKLFVLFIVSLAIFAYAGSAAGTEEKLLKLFSRNQHESSLDKKQKLQLAKFLIANGDIKKAKHYLSGTYDLGRNGDQVKDRYLAFISFIEDDHGALPDYFEADFKFYPHICMLKVIHHLINWEMDKTKAEFTTCKLRIESYNQDNFFWLGQLIKIMEKISKLKTAEEGAWEEEKNKYIINPKNFFELVKFVDSSHLALLWMKLGLYTGLYDDIIKLVPNLPEEAFESERFREIMGLLYLRKGDLETAQTFIEDIDSANSHNIMAGIYLKRRKPELAYGELLLALKKKSNSRNALEKLVPFSYIMQKRDKGLQAIEKLKHMGITPINLSILKSAFLTRSKQYKKAWIELSSFDLSDSKYVPDKVFQMKNYLSILLDYPEESNKYANYACKQFDGLSCWIQVQNMIWPNFSGHFNQKREARPKRFFDIDKMTKEETSKDIDEEIIVDQENLEQLDNTELIQEDIWNNRL